MRRRNPATGRMENHQVDRLHWQMPFVGGMRNYRIVGRCALGHLMSRYSIYGGIRHLVAGEGLRHEVTYDRPGVERRFRRLKEALRG